MLDAGFERAPTLLALSVAGAFARLFCEDVRSAPGRRGLRPWLEATCGELQLDPRVAAMLERSRDVLEPIVGNDEAVRTVLLDAERAIRESLAKHRGAEPGVAGSDELDATIAALIVRLDDADSISAEHSRAVALWCRRLATVLNYEEHEVRFASRCGLVHDVGKAKTPKDILLAPRALSESEWAVMRDHTVEGARILAEFSSLHPFVSAARSHHERLDGKGYPDGLAARDISPVVRIVSVADSFNAMIGRRPYRLPLSPAVALEQLVKNRGTQFDPDVVDAMLLVLERS